MISREEVLHLAELSRLQLSEAEMASLQKDISSILEYVGQVSKVEVHKVKEVGATHTVMRDDLPRDADNLLADKEEALRSAFPVREGGYNVVRKIIQKDE